MAPGPWWLAVQEKRAELENQFKQSENERSVQLIQLNDLTKQVGGWGR
jgi:hypothetical protein